MIYFTGLRDGAKLIAHDMGKNQTVWENNIGHGVEYALVYLQTKIITSIDDRNWADIKNLIYPISIPFPTVSSGVTKVNFPSALVVSKNIP